MGYTERDRGERKKSNVHSTRSLKSLDNLKPGVLAGVPICPTLPDGLLGSDQQVPLSMKAPPTILCARQGGVCVCKS